MKTHSTSATSNVGPKGDEGFTIIDFLMIVLMLTILAVIVPAVSLPAIQEGRVERTKARLLAIRKAIIGDPAQSVRGARTDFGFLGDMGRVPADISELLVQPVGSGNYAQDQDVRFAYGWNGPYLDTSDSEVDWTKDAWGNALDYVVGTTSTPTVITSYGADSQLGGTNLDADLIVEIAPEATRFTLHGFVTDSGGGAFTGTGEVVLNDLNGAGALQTPIPTAIATSGYFSFSNVSLGRRSVYLLLPSPSPTVTVGPVTVSPGGPHVVLPARHLEAP
jgi:type II secretory pathway pseudopilin PulG